MKALVLLTVLGLAQSHRVDLNAEPWGRVMDLVRSSGDERAQAVLERIGTDTAMQPWERAHALRWAGELAARGGRRTDAERDFLRARAQDPGGFDGGMAAVKLGELAMAEKRWWQARAMLSEAARNGDPVVRFYANDRLRAVQDRVPRLVLRYASMAVVAAAVASVVLRVARRAGRRPGALRAFGWALLAGEALAIGGAVLVPRVTTQLATSGWMAAAIPSALAGAAVWATRDTSARAPWWKRAGVVAFALLSFAAALYLALDVTWWSVERPVA